MSKSSVALPGPPVGRDGDGSKPGKDVATCEAYPDDNDSQLGK